jgi:hypothetical protein
MYLNNEIYSTKLQRYVIRKYDHYDMSQHTPHNRVGLHKIQHSKVILIHLLHFSKAI